VTIYTRRGDKGETDLLGGRRVAKDDLRVEAYGAVDELDARLGVCAAESGHEDLRELVHVIQGRMFELGAYLAAPDAEQRRRSGVPEPGDGDVAVLEAQIDTLTRELDPLRHFILPGGSRAAAAFHVARTACRRAERRAVQLHRESPLEPAALRYLNRLSDLLFVMARVENRRAGVDDIEWHNKGSSGD